MAIIYTYPTKATPNDNDLILISDSEDSNKTKQVKISSLPGGSGSGVSSVTATLPLASTGGSTPVISLTGLTGFGAAGQVIKVNSGANGLEWGAAGSGVSYQAGNGIDIDTSTNPDTISTGLLANGGLVFSSNKLQVDLAATAMSGRLRVVDGGTNIGTYAQGDLLYAATTSSLSALNTSSGNKFLGTATASPYYPEWKTNLVPEEVNTGNLLIGGATSTSEMTLLNTTTKGTIAVGNGSTTVTKAVGTDGYVLTAKSADATGVNWEAITFPTVNLTSGVSGTLPVGNGGIGVATVAVGTITRGNGTSGLIADTYLQYEGTQKSLKIRGTGDTPPSLSCTLSINDSQGPSGKAACIGLTPTGSQGAKGVHVDLGAYNEGIQIDRNNALASTAMRFNQTVSGSSTVGSITVSNSATAFNTSSDYRLKENIVDMTGSVDRVKQLKPKRFNFTNDTENTVDGFLAHEAQTVVPESVTGTKDEVDNNGDAVYQGIDQAKLVPLLVGAIKELTARIEALEA
tara:strand:+ start:320 stop:1867 length:1548 start_codon:yes stop_codon:yes gene_type:complete